MNNPWPRQSDALAFYGNPDANNDGMPDPIWERDNIARIVPSYPMFWSWSQQPVKTIAIHKKCALSLISILTEIGKIPEANRRHYQLDQCGGAYAFRPMRGLNQLSMHAFGAAIDLAPVINPLGKPWTPKSNMMPIEVVKIFEAHGWTWGGDWNDNGITTDQRRHDSMHFQATKPL